MKATSSPRALNLTLVILVGLCLSLLAVFAWFDYTARSLPQLTRLQGADPLPPGAGAVPGGLLVNLTDVTNPDQTIKLCTLGPAWVGPDGSVGWLTAGHCADEPLEAHANVSRGFQRKVGTTSFYGQPAVPVDGGYITADKPDLPAGFVHAGGKNSVLPVVGSASPTPGMVLCIQGAYSGSLCGYTVTDLEVTQQMQSGQVLETMVAKAQATICAQDGDSGGPVWTNTPEGVKIVGVVTAQYTRPGLGAVIPDTCALYFTSLESIQKSIGGHLLTASS